MTVAAQAGNLAAVSQPGQLATARDGGLGAQAGVQPQKLHALQARGLVPLRVE